MPVSNQRDAIEVALAVAEHITADMIQDCMSAFNQRVGPKYAMAALLCALEYMRAMLDDQISLNLKPEDREELETWIKGIYEKRPRRIEYIQDLQTDPRFNPNVSDVTGEA